MSELFPGIKQISQTGNDMYVQGAFPVGIGNTDVAYLADPADTMLLAGRDSVIHEVSVGISGEEAALYDVSGTPPLSLPNSLGKPLKAWAVNLSPYQEGTGDPAPDNVRPIHGTDKVNLFAEESYDPTATPKAVITLPSTIYSGSVFDGGAGSRTRKVVLDGTETITQSDIGLSTMMFVVLANDVIRRSDATIPLRCTQYKYVHWNQSPWNVDLSVSYYQTGSFRIKDVRFATVEEFKTYLATQYANGTPVEVEYQIITPQTFTITTPSIPTPRGNATAWATAEDGTVDSMEVTYVGKA